MVEDLSIDELTDHFDNIDLLREIEGGANKRVFEAEHGGERVAFKLVPIDVRRVEGYARREIETMQLIDSPILVDLLDYAWDTIAETQVVILIEEFVEGETLEAIIQEDGGSLDLGLCVVESLLTVLQPFAEEEIIHRDIKPANIMVRPNGEVTLLDVGIVRMQNKTSLTPTFAPHAPGTYAYSAPEQLQNDKDLQDRRTDLFATGIVMFETMTAEHPFDIRDVEITVPDAILEGERKELEGYLEDESLEKDLNKFFKRLTAYEPYERFRKPEFALERLEEIEGR